MSDRLNRILVDINKKASISDIAEDQSPLNIQLSSVNRLHVEEVYIGGRICSPENFQTDLSNREWDRRLHPNSVFLETVDGNRVQLNLQDLDQFSVFPGQVVVCKGRSGFNQQFLVSQIFQVIHFDRFFFSIISSFWI